MELDSGTLTHVAAVLVGVLVTAIVAQLLSGGSSKTVEEAPAAAGSAGGGKKKKKKKKAKATEEEATETTKQAPKAAEPTASSGKKKKKTNGNNSNSDAADKENATENGAANGKNGKKKKKKNNNNNNNKGNTGGAGAASSSSEKTDFQKANAPAPAPVYVAPTDPVVAPPREEEEEWNDVASSKKKKKSQRPKKVAPAAAAATSAPTSLTETLSIDAKKVGIIIGPKGTTMEAIKAATGCSLEINAPAGSEDNKKPLPPGAKAGVIIQGCTKEDILKAKNAVQELAAKGYATLLQGDNFGETGIEVHPRFLSEIVGPSGRTIQALQKTLDVKITIPPTDWKPNAPQVVGVVKPCRVGIAGSKENARKCKESIQNIMQYHYDAVSHPGVIHEEVYVPHEFFHCVIGPRGSEIKHIRGNYKVDVYMPNSESVSENVIVVGKQSQVDKAISYIQLLMDRDTEQRNKKYSDEYYG